jgi:hypothetical protein
MIGLLLLWTLASVQPAHATVLFSDSFTDGDLTANPTWWSGSGFLVANDPLNSTNKVMQTPGGFARTCTTHSTNVTSSTGTPLSLSMRINTDAGGDNYWNSHWSLRTTAGLQSGFGWNSSGYGFCLSGDKKTFLIEKTTKDGGGVNTPLTVTVATVTLTNSPFVAGWNTVLFTWATNGTLTLYLNGDRVLTATDITFTPAFYQLADTNFLNNSNPSPSGRLLSFDDIVVTDVIPNTVFTDAFTDAELAAAPAWSNPNAYLVVNDPLNSTNKTLQTPGGATRTTTLSSSAVTPSYSVPQTLTFRFNAQDVGDSTWSSRWSFRIATGTQSGTDWKSSGYGLALNGDGRTFAIEKITKDGGGSGVPGSSTVATATLGASIYTTGWNSVSFTWGQGGALSLAVNGTTVVTGTDTTHALALAQLASTNFLNNGTGYKLYFDNILVTNISAPTGLFYDPFNDGNVTSNPIWSNTNSYVVVNDPLDSTNKVLQTPGGTTRTVCLHSTNVTPCSGAPLTMTLRINADATGDNNWNSRWFFRTSAGSQYGYDYNSSGYGVNLGKTTFQILKETKDGAGAGAPSVATVSTITLGTSPLTAGWNTVTFTWNPDGTLVLAVNGTQVLTGTDTTFSPAFYQIVNISFLNNTDPTPSGRLLSFDDVLVTSSQPATGVHPRIVFTAAELPSLRQRITTNPALGGYNACVGKATDLGTTTSAVYGYLTRLEAGNTPVLTDAERQTYTSTLEQAALACLLGQDATKVTYTKRALLAFVRNVPTSTSGMDYSRNVRGVALAYDWLFNYLTASEQQEVRQWLAAIGEVWEVQLDSADYGFYGPASARNYNWVPFITGSFQLSVLAIEGETGYQSEWYTKAKSSLTDYLDYGIGAEGCPVESIHYFSYGMTNGAYAYAALARRGEPIFTHAHLSKVPTWWAHDLFPWGKDFNDLQDTTDQTVGQGEIYYLLTQMYPGDRTVKWINANYQRGCSTGVSSSATTVLWQVAPDDTVTAASLNLPLSGYFAYNGLAYMRSGWSTDDMYLEFQSDPIGAGPSHMHADRNAFTLMGKGRMWAIDGGGWAPQDIFHNELLIDGAGEGYFPHYGEITNYTDTSWYTAITGNAKEAYDYQTQMESRIPPNELGTIWTMIDGFWSKPYNPVLRANRTAVRVSGAHQYALILDDIAKDSAYHNYTWQMLSGLGNTYEAVNSTTCRLTPVDAGAYFHINPAVAYNQRATITASFNITTAGNYKAWLLMGREYWTPWNNRMNIWFDTKPTTPAIIYGQTAINADVHWQQALGSTALTAGAHTFSLNDGGMGHTDLRFAALLIAPDTFNPVAVPTPAFPAGSYYTRLSDITPVPTGWLKVDAPTNAPKLLVQILNPSTGITFTAEDFDRIRPDTLENKGPAFRLKATGSSDEPKFRVFLYPYREGDPLPTITANADGATIGWPDGVTDTWVFNGNSTVSGTRTP